VLLHFILNNKEVSLDTDPLRRLLDVLREDFNLTGVKEGCGEGECGSCAVLLDGKIVNSCLVAVGTVDKCEVATIEAFRETERYRALEDAFIKAGSVQCGFCTPGFIIAAESLLRENPNPDEEEIREAISGNLCRCTGYNMIVEGIKIASERGRGLW
jgi:carbon-monoxide dehydrogenase small subunit